MNSGLRFWNLMFQFFSIHFFSYEYCPHKACIFVWEWSVEVRYENYLPPFRWKGECLEQKVFGYPLAMQINITTDLFFEKTRI